MKKVLTQLNPTTWMQDIGDIDFVIEIGDVKSDEFRPQVKILRWDNGLEGGGGSGNIDQGFSELEMAQELEQLGGGGRGEVSLAAGTAGTSGDINTVGGMGIIPNGGHCC